VRAFLDTNVLVYAVDEADERRRAIARDLLARGADGDGGRDGGGFVISTQVLSEFLVAVRRLAIPVGEDVALGIVRDLAASVEIHVPSVADIIGAAERAVREKIHHYDALIVQAAVSAGCGVLITEGLQDGRRFDGVTVTDPFR
jgi:predicted nucleic acid-binding protein